MSDGVAPVVQKVVVQVDFDRARFGARAAQGRGIGEVFPIR